MQSEPVHERVHELVVPELVHTDEQCYKSVAYDKMTALLIEAVKELKSENEALRARMTTLEGAM